MTADETLLEETAEDLFENAPCGYLATRMDGTIVKVNRTFESWTGRPRDELLAGARFQDLPALINSVVRTDDAGSPRVIRTTVFDATDRRRYEQELLHARRREQDIAQRLQRSMLSGRLPGAPGLQLDVAYRPAEAGLEIGGDWYDAFWLEEETAVGLVVGDVVGRGIEAAATMGQLRSAVRALASTGLSPSRLLDGLDEFVRRHKVGQMATLVYGELDLAVRRLRYACAGHPPPAVLAPGEGATFAWDGRSLPLDALDASADPRGEAELVLPPGATVLLYTDGLVERRSSNVTDDLERLLRELDAPRDAPVTAADVVRALEGPEHADDVCALALRLA